MGDAIRSEWIKLSTLTVNKVLIAVAVAFPLVVSALVAGLADEVLDTSDLVDFIATLTWLSSLLFGVVATINMSGEFNYNTIRPTFAAQPRRLRPLVAKLLVLLAVTVVLMAGVIVVCWLILSNLADGNFPLESEFGQDSPVTALVGSGLLGVGVVIAGFGLGNLIRNTPAAVTFLLLWPLVIENILARLAVRRPRSRVGAVPAVHRGPHARVRRPRRRRRHHEPNWCRRVLLRRRDRHHGVRRRPYAAQRRVRRLSAATQAVAGRSGEHAAPRSDYPRSLHGQRIHCLP